MKFRFILENNLTKEKINFRTLKELSEFINVPYHQTRSIYLADEKLFLHPQIKKLKEDYKIYKYTD